VYWGNGELGREEKRQSAITESYRQALLVNEGLVLLEETRIAEKGDKKAGNRKKIRIKETVGRR
jgi:hypothetical protein